MEPCVETFQVKVHDVDLYADVQIYSHEEWEPERVYDLWNEGKVQQDLWPVLSDPVREDIERQIADQMPDAMAAQCAYRYEEMVI